MPTIALQKWRFLILALGLVAAAARLQSQQASATVTFEQTFPGSDPGHYIISVASGCAATYQSNGKLSEQAAADESFQLDFVAPKTDCDKIFDLAKRARYFSGEVDSRKKGLASLGSKVLSYTDGVRTNRAAYNYSKIAEVQELTTLFQGLGEILEFGRRLEYHHRYQKLALNEDLRQLEEADKNTLVEIEVITPALRKIADDASLMNVVRGRAQRLLEAGK